MKYILSVVFLAVCLAVVSIPPLFSKEVKENQSPLSAQELLMQTEKMVSDFDSLQTEFIQEKNLAIFKNKIAINGRIYLKKPHKIAWHVDAPLKYSVLITDKYIQQWDEASNRVQKIPIDSNPMFSVVIEQLSAWFSGRYSDMITDYDLDLISRDPVEIEFFPKEKLSLSRVVKSIRVTFRQDRRYLQKIHFQEVSGDSTTITFKNTVINPSLDEKVFSLRQHV